MNFTIKQQPMLCSSHEASKRRYKKLKGKSGRTWLVAVQENEGDNVYVEGRFGDSPGFEGFGGRTIPFTLENGEKLELKGPWQSSSEGLYKDTGYDVRDKHLTFLVISKTRETDEKGRTVMVDVLWLDPAPRIGSFHRGKKIAQNMADIRGERVMRYSESTGGSSNGPVEPQEPK